MRKELRTTAIDLALQGGGSHGAFTWGVLDRLLEDDTLGIAGLSGTSAGALSFGQRLIDEGHIQAHDCKNLRLHMVADDKGLAPLRASSKLNTDRSFLQALQALGRAAADRWLLAHRADVGVRGTLDLQGTFLTPRTPPRTSPGHPASRRSRRLKP